MTVVENIKRQASFLRREWSELNALLCRATKAEEQITITNSKIALLESICVHKVEPLGSDGSICTICGKRWI